MINKFTFEVPNMVFLKSLYLCHVNHKKLLLITPWINTCKFLKRISYFFQLNIGLIEVQDFRKIKKFKKWRKKKPVPGEIWSKKHESEITIVHQKSQHGRLPMVIFTFGKNICFFMFFSKIMIKTTLVLRRKNTSKVTLGTWHVFLINDVLIIKKCIPETNLRISLVHP